MKISSNLCHRFLLRAAFIAFLPGLAEAAPQSERVEPPQGADALAVAEAVRAPGTRGLRVANPGEIVERYLPTLLEEARTDAGGHRLQALYALEVLGKALGEGGAHLPPEVETPILEVLRNEEPGLRRSTAASVLPYVRPLSGEALQFLIGITRDPAFREAQGGAWRTLISLVEDSDMAKQAILESLLQDGEGLGLADRIKHFDPEILAAAVAAFQELGGGNMPGSAYLKRFEAQIPNRAALFDSIAATILDTSLDGVRRDMAFGNLLTFKSPEAQAAVERVIPILLKEPNTPRELLRAAIRMTVHLGERVPSREALLATIAEGGDEELANEAAHALRGQIATPIRRHN